jgi:AraC-like DNA-binding protein
MVAQHNFALLKIRLEPGDEWVAKGPVLANSRLTFVFAGAGSGRWIEATQEFPLTQGDMLVLNPSSAGKLCVGVERAMVVQHFSLCLEQLLPLSAGREFGLLPGLTSRFNAGRLYPASSPLAVECWRRLDAVPRPVNFDHRAQLLRIAAVVLSVELDLSPGPPGRFVRVEEHMDRVLDQLCVEDIMQLSVQQLATKFACSRRHLNRLFHRRFGLSVQALRTEMRLLKAVALLRDADAKIINVADQCGFSHLGFFNVSFRRRFGASPSQWRKRLQGFERPPFTIVDGNSSCRLRAKGLCPWSIRGKTNRPALDNSIQIHNQRPSSLPTTTPRHCVAPLFDSELPQNFKNAG